MASNQILSLPGPSVGLSPASAASSWGFGSWVVVAPNTGTGIAIHGLSVQSTNIPTADTTVEQLFEIGIGAGGSETTQIQLPYTLLSDTAVGIYLTTHYEIALPEPVFLAAGTRIAVRVADSLVSAVTYQGVKVIYRETAAPTVALNTINAITFASTTPTLQFTGTDPESQDVRYNIQLSSATFPTVPFQDDFDDNFIDTNFWDTAGSGSNVAETGQRLEITTNAGAAGAFFSVESRTTYSLDETSVTVELVSAGNQSLVSLNALFLLELNTTGDNQLMMSVINNVLTFRSRVATVNSDTTTTYSSTSHRWLRFRETGGTTYFETSPSGIAGTWTVRRSLANPHGSLNYLVALVAGTSASEGSTSLVVFDNLNIEQPLVSRVSGTDAGFVNTVNGGDTDPFTSGQKVNYTVQAGDALTNVSTYYYRARAKDPSGGNAYGVWSTTRSFTLAVPPTIVLNTADVSVFGSATPTLEFTGTDIESQDVRYNVQVHTLFYSQTFSQGSIPTGWTQFGSGTWTYDSSTGTQSTIAASSASHKVMFTGSSCGGTQARSVKCQLNFNVLATGGDERVGITILGNNTNSNGVNLVYNGFNGLRFLEDNIAWGPSAAWAPVAGETWNIRGMYSAGVFSGKVWLAGTSEPAAWTITWTLTANGAYLYSGITGNVDSPTNTSRASYDNFLVEPATPLLNEVSGTDAGFVNTVNGGDTDPFTSGEKVSFTVQAGDALSAGTTYYWKASAIDPSGGNVYSDWTETRSFTIVLTQIKKFIGVTQATIKKATGVPIAGIKKLGGVTN